MRQRSALLTTPADKEPPTAVHDHHHLTMWSIDFFHTLRDVLHEHVKDAANAAKASDGAPPKTEIHPALAAKHQHLLVECLNVFMAVESGLMQLLEDGGAEMPTKTRNALTALQDAIDGIESKEPMLLAGVMPPDATPFTSLQAVTQFLKMEHQGRLIVREQTIDRPETLDVLHDMNARSYVAADLGTHLKELLRDVPRATPQVRAYVVALFQMLTGDSHASMLESQLQSDILQLLAAVAQGFTQDRMDHRRHKPGAVIGRLMPEKVARPLGKLFHMNTESPAQYGQRMKQELDSDFSRYLFVQAGDRNIKVQPKPEAPGLTSMHALLSTLAAGSAPDNPNKNNSSIINTTIEVSPNLEWGTQGPQHGLELTSAALTQLGPEGERIIAQGIAPKDRMEDSMKHAIEGGKLVPLKVNLTETLLPQIAAKEKSSQSLFNFRKGVSDQKSELLKQLETNIAVSDHVDQIDAAINIAKENNHTIALNAWLPNDGTTGQLLTQLQGEMKTDEKQPPLRPLPDRKA